MGKKKGGARVPKSAALTPHLDSERLARGVERCLPIATAWNGDFFRFTGMEYANRRDVVTGEGSRRAGGRWNGKGSFRTVYGSLDTETARKESLAHHRRQGLPDSEALPLVLVGLRVAADRVLDLTDGRVRRELGVSEDRLVAESWRTVQQAGQEALTQAIGRLARDADLQGLIVPSAERPVGRNIVLFPDRLTGPVTVIRGEELPARRRRKRTPRPPTEKS